MLAKTVRTGFAVGCMIPPYIKQIAYEAVSALDNFEKDHQPKLYDFHEGLEQLCESHPVFKAVARLQEECSMLPVEGQNLWRAVLTAANDPDRYRRVFRVAREFRDWIVQEFELEQSKPDRPVWDQTIRTLYVKGQKPMKFAAVATNQMCVLNAFQERGWPPCIENPLPKDRHFDDSKEHLKDAIKALRRIPGLMFRRSGEKDGICWEPSST